MVIVKIMGGLGNQMFQYALAYSLMIHGKEVKLDTGYFDSIPAGDTFRICYMDLLKIDIPRADPKEIKRYTSKRRIIESILNEKIGIGKRWVVSDNTEHLVDVFAVDEVYLIGYWQSEQYFIQQSVAEVILDKFDFSRMSLNVCSQKYKSMISKVSNSVSIHIRGGDYLNEYNKKNLGVICGRQYYENAVSYMNKRLGSCRYFIFTNDKDYAQYLLRDIEWNGNEYCYLDANSENDGWADIYLMSFCSHNIIANSSFSWWGSWLNRNKNKLVIAPCKWDAEEKNKLIYCHNWKKI